MRHSSSLANLVDRQLHNLSTSKMKISNKSAPDLLKKAVTSIKSKTDALRTKLIILASLRRRMAIVAAVSRKVHTLVSSSSSQEKMAADRRHSRALALSNKAMATPSQGPPATTGGGGERGGSNNKAHLSLFEIAVFDEDDDHVYRGDHYWTSSSLFDDGNYRCSNEEEEEDVHQEDGADDLDDVLGALHEPSVIEVIRSNREAEGLKFNIDDEIDEACDMFIRRCRSRMDLSLY